MACAHAKFTGEVGVCLATSGPGAIHLLNGLYDAKHGPPAGGRHRRPAGAHGARRRLPAGGRPDHAVQGRRARITCTCGHARRRCGTWSTGPCASPGGARRHLHHLPQRPAGRAGGAQRRRASTAASSRASATRAAHRPERRGPAARGRGAQRGREGRDAGRRRRAGAPPTRCCEVADLLGAGVAKALLGKAALPDDLPFVTGSIGLLGTKPSWEMMKDCDTLLMVGSSFPYSEFLPKEGQARGVQIDIEPRMLEPALSRWRCNLLGDARETLRALMPLLERKTDRSWRERDRGARSPTGGRCWRARRHERARTRSTRSACSGSCRRACRTAASSPADSGSAANWFARDLKIRARHDGLALGQPRDHGPGRALRDRRQVRVSRTGR